MNFNIKYLSIYLFVTVEILFLCFLSNNGYAQDTSSPKVITIRAVGGLQYDIVRFKVSPGEPVRLILKNTDDMDHNMLITKPGKRKDVVKDALVMGDQGPIKNFVPESPFILYHIPVLSPGEEATITFTAPKTEGIYPYVCTYPGHGMIMYGAMYVTTEDLPPLSEDLNIPEHRRSSNVNPSSSMTHHKKWHPYDLTPPYFYRIFMPQSGPASIAVRLSEDLAYCWDAGVCRLRYIWEGDFLDISEPWSIKGDATAKVLGTVFYRDNEEHPLRDINGSPEIQYLGYRVKEGGYPEFHYIIDRIEVYELIKPTTNKKRLARQFTLPQLEENIVFSYTPQPGVTVTSNHGIWQKNKLILTRDNAKKFTIFIEPSSK